MPRIGNYQTISGTELRHRLEGLGLSHIEAARQLGLSEDGLYKAMRGDRRVGRQTEIILDFLEGKRRPRAKSTKARAPRRARSLAKYLY